MEREIRTHETTRDREARRTAGRTGQLSRLKDLDHYSVADGDPDIRGWDVRTQDGREIGKVDELIVDPAALKVRYMEVKLKKEVHGAGDDRWALIPIGTAQLNEDKDDVIIDRLPTGRFLAKDERREANLTREQEQALREQYGATSTGLAADPTVGTTTGDDFYRDPLYDDRRMWEKRRREREDEYIVRVRDDEGEVEIRRPIHSDDRG